MIWKSGGALLFVGLGVFLWGSLLSGNFRRETSVTTGHVVEGKRYEFFHATRVYGGELEESAETGSDLRVFFDPDDPSRHHARPDGKPPPVTDDSGFFLPAVGGVFCLAIGIGFLIALGGKKR